MPASTVAVVVERNGLRRFSIQCVWWADVLTRRDVAHRSPERVKGQGGGDEEVARVRPLVLPPARARMFACYYCRQISTSRATDAHYNCKGERLPRVISQNALGMCIRERSEFRIRPRNRRGHPVTHHLFHFLPADVEPPLAQRGRNLIIFRSGHVARKSADR